jgi:hypothetical protein
VRVAQEFVFEVALGIVMASSGKQAPVGALLFQASERLLG